MGDPWQGLSGAREAKPPMSPGGSKNLDLKIQTLWRCACVHTSIVYRKTQAMGYVYASLRICNICGDFCGSAWRRMCAFFAFSALFATNKTLFPKKLSSRIVLVVDAIFTPNLTILGLFSPEIAWRKTSHPPRHQHYFAISEPQCCEE